MGKFSATIKGFAAKAPKTIDKVRRASCLDLFRLIINNTPVDKGLLRGNWRTSVGFPQTEPIPRTEKEDGTEVFAEAASNLGGLHDTVYFTNNLPYAQRIEYDGWSEFKAPQGMVRKNVIRWPEIVAKNNREYGNK